MERSDLKVEKGRVRAKIMQVHLLVPTKQTHPFFSTGRREMEAERGLGCYGSEAHGRDSVKEAFSTPSPHDNACEKQVEVCVAGIIFSSFLLEEPAAD